MANKEEVKRIANWIVIVVVLLLAGYGFWVLQGQKTQYNQVEIDTSVEKLEVIKERIVEELSTDCEVKGVPEGSQNGITVMDSNSYYSRGKWQFQTLTIQHYYEVLYNQTLTIDEAVLIAHTENKARSLAYDIIWTEVGGIWNWKNCADKLGLAQKIEIVRELEK